MTRPPAAPVGRATPPPMSLDELRAAAERVICEGTHQPPCSCAGDWAGPDDALALATFVRDLLTMRPTKVVERIGPVVQVDELNIYAHEARRVAADLLRAAESAGSLPEARVHEEPGRPGR
jgi:hypothetical protein